MSIFATAQARIFLALAVIVYATALILASRLAGLEHPHVLAAALGIDLALLVPAAFWFLVVRPGDGKLIQVAPLAVVGLVTAYLVLPAEYSSSLLVVEAIVLPAELCLLGWVALRVRRDLKRDGERDPLHRFQSASRAALGESLPAEVLGTELAVLGFLRSWRANPHVPNGTRAFSHHKRCNHGSIVFALVLATVAETIGIHMLLTRWSVGIAWCFTALSVYGAFWLVADWRATVLRPLLLDEAGITLRAGLRWEARVNFTTVESLEDRRPEGPKNRQMSCVLLGEPDVWLLLNEPVEARGPYGIRRMVTAIGLSPDDREEFATQISAALERLDETRG